MEYALPTPSVENSEYGAESRPESRVEQSE